MSDRQSIVVDLNAQDNGFSSSLENAMRLLNDVSNAKNDMLCSISGISNTLDNVTSSLNNMNNAASQSHPIMQGLVVAMTLLKAAYKAATVVKYAKVAAKALAMTSLGEKQKHLKKLRKHIEDKKQAIKNHTKALNNNTQALNKTSSELENTSTSVKNLRIDFALIDLQYILRDGV